MGALGGQRQNRSSGKHFRHPSLLPTMYIVFTYCGRRGTDSLVGFGPSGMSDGRDRYVGLNPYQSNVYA